MNSLYSRFSKIRLRRFILSCGGVEKAAERLDVYSVALIQMLYDEPIPEYARRNIEYVVGPLVPAEQTAATSLHKRTRQPERAIHSPNRSLGGDSLAEAVKELLAAEGSVQAVSSKLGVRPSTINKVLNGIPLTSTTRIKLSSVLRLSTIPQADTASATTSSEVCTQQTDVKPRLLELMKDESGTAVFEVASRLGVNASSIRKVLDGTPVSKALENKLRNALENVAASEGNKCLRPSKIDRYYEVFKLYRKLGTLEAVGKQLGVTRQRVRQILVKGTDIGLFEYKPYDYAYVPRDKLITDLIKYRSLGEVAKANQISSTYLHKLMTTYSITENNLETYRTENRRLRCIEEYIKFTDMLGHDPTTTELQRTPTGHALHGRIVRLWGSIDTFREALRIPRPARVSPHWLEPGRQIAFISRMQHLDTLRDCLSSVSPKSISEIALDCSFTTNRVRRLLALLIASGEVERLGTHSNTRYRLYNR